MPIEIYSLVFPLISKAIARLVQNPEEVHNLHVTGYTGLLPDCAINAIWLITHWKIMSYNITDWLMHHENPHSLKPSLATVLSDIR